VRPDRRFSELQFKALLFLLSLGFLLGTILWGQSHRTAQASVLQWVIKGPVQTSDPWDNGAGEIRKESGWHYNDGTRAAKDYHRNCSGGGCTTFNDAILWAVMSTNSGYQWAYNVTSSSCRAVATAHYNSGGWQPAGIATLEFVHVVSVSTGWSGTMQSVSSADGIWKTVGTIATSACLGPGPHVHIASNVADSGVGTYVYRHLLDDETCWGTLAQCEYYDYTRRQDPNVSCAVSADIENGSWDRSGSATDYLDCVWQEEWRGQSEDVFELWF